MNPKCAILVTTFLRDNLLEQAILSMLKYRPENTVILIADQGQRNIDIKKKDYYEGIGCYFYTLPFDIGLSWARNYLVKMAKEMGCEYCIMASDSFIFTEQTKNINDMIPYLEKDFDLIGFNLKGVRINWAGYIDLIPGKCFSLDFIDRSKIPDIGPIHKCSIVMNFFIAKTESLSKVKWNENLKLAEHELYFNDYKNAGYKVGYTSSICCDTFKTRDGACGLYRAENWTNSLQKLYKICGIKTWIEYKNRQNGFYGI